MRNLYLQAPAGRRLTAGGILDKETKDINTSICDFLLFSFSETDGKDQHLFFNLPFNNKSKIFQVKFILVCFFGTHY